MPHEDPGSAAASHATASHGSPGAGDTRPRPAWRDALAAAVGPVLFPEDDGYAALAMPWNVAVPSRPAAVVYAADAEDVARTLRFATEHRIPVTVQCTGHGAVAGTDDALLIATRRLDECTVHADARWARVGAGVTWQRVLDAAAPHGLAPLAGSSPGVGVVGYTTGGGTGPIARTHGLASDRVRAFDLVTGDGRQLRVTPTENPDLFWGLRGGKGTLGVVTAIELDLLPIRELYAGALYFDGADAAGVLAAWSEWCPSLPPDATTSVALLQLPPIPGVPELLAGRFTVAVRFAWTGVPDEGIAVLAPLRAAAPSIIDAVALMPYPALGAIHSDPVDPLPAHEATTLLEGLPAAAVERLLAVAGPDASSPQVIVEIRQLGGALAAGGTLASAFCHGDAAFSLLTIGITAPPVGEAVVAHAAAVLDAMAPWSTGGVLPNFAPGDDAARFRRVYTPETLARLRALSQASDPARVLVAARGLFAEQVTGSKAR